jgi:hypothetical protein
VVFSVRSREVAKKVFGWLCLPFLHHGLFMSDLSFAEMWTVSSVVGSLGSTSMVEDVIRNGFV